MKKETQTTNSKERPYSLRDHSSKPKVNIPQSNYQLQYQGIPFPSPSNNGSPKNSHLWRKGKWFDEEESYTEKLIEAFIKGYLNIPGGTTLRSFLSEQLCCDPMRITKKFAGSHGIGKHVFAPADMKVVDEEEMMDVLRSLEEAQERFHRKSLQIEPMYHQQFHSNDPYHRSPSVYNQQPHPQDYFMMIPPPPMAYYAPPPGSYYYYTPYSEPETQSEEQEDISSDNYNNDNSPKRQKKQTNATKSKRSKEDPLPTVSEATIDHMSYASALLMDFYLSGWRDTTSNASSTSSLSSASSSDPSTPAPLAASSSSSRRKRSLEESEQPESVEEAH